MVLPIAIFGYNRPQSLGRLIHGLLSCERVENARVTIFLDGPKTELDASAVDQCRKMAERLAPSGWNIRAAEQNLGLKRSIVRGVSEVCAEYGRAIVLEDDLVLSDKTLCYFGDALERYKAEPRVWSICGYMFAARELANWSTNFFLPYANPWGWATWERAWSKFDPGEDFDTLIQNRTARTLFNVNGFFPLSEMLALDRAGLINSWYVRWYAKQFREGGLSLFPPISFIRNGGIGRGGTHGSALNPYRLFRVPETELATQVAQMPSRVETDFSALELARKSPELKVHRTIARLGKLKRRAYAAMR